MGDQAEGVGMTTSMWQPTSSVGWVDVDRAEAQRVRELFGLFASPEAIDPHGILPLQIGLSDQLFPGMSTQHTRARYVFFTAWHAQRLVHLHSRQSTSKILREDELALMRSLLEGDDKVGIFGKRKREKTETLPTSIYWSALQRWRVVNPQLALAQVHQNTASARAVNSLVQRSDDESSMPDWSGNRVIPVDFPKEPKGFPEKKQRIGLTKDEAEYLIDRVAASCHDSFLKVVFNRPELADGDQPWSVDPNAGGQALIDARCFSELIHPARLLYTKLLVDDARERGAQLDDIAEGLEIAFSEWLEECEPRTHDLRSWVGNRLDPLLNEQGFRMSANRKKFVVGALTKVANDPEGSWSDTELHELVRWIERVVKKRNARLTPGQPFERWLKRPSRIASRRIDYRWGNVQRFVDDVQAAL